MRGDDYERADAAYTRALESLKRSIDEMNSITEPAQSRTAAGSLVW